MDGDFMVILIILVALILLIMIWRDIGRNINELLIFIGRVLVIIGKAILWMFKGIVALIMFLIKIHKKKKAERDRAIPHRAGCLYKW